MLSLNQKLRRSLRLLALAPVVGVPSLALAQLPPPDLVLSEPRQALLEIGPVDFHVLANMSFVYDDNINLHENPASGGIDTNGKPIPTGSDFIYTFTPALIFTKPNTLEGTRTTWSVNYSPSFIYFFKNTDESSIDQSVQAQAGYALTKLTLGLSASYVQTDGGVVDVGSRVNQTGYNVALTARYEMSEKTFFQMDGSFTLTDYETLTDSDEWRVTPTVNYQISPKVTVGLGLTVGQLYVDQQTSETVGTNTFITTQVEPQTYLGPTLTARYQSTEKTDVSLSVSEEWRSYPDGNTSIKPVFTLAGSYRPFDGTAFGLSAYQTIENSAVISGANYTTTGCAVSARQRLRDRLFATFGFTYNYSVYAPTTTGVVTSRVDDYLLLRTGLEATVGQNWTVGIFYQFSQDVSTDKTYSYHDTQVGIQAGWAY